MNTSKIFYYFIMFVIWAVTLCAQNTNPEVTNVQFGTSGSTITVTYDVADAEQSTVTIKMLVSSDNGTTWSFNYGQANGDIGSGVTIGSNKTITWTYSGSPSDQFKIRIYANDETADGNPCPGIETVSHAGKTYSTIQIGFQCWLKENLDVGTRINGSSDQTNNGTIEKYCYNDDPANCTTYGGLYQWNEAMQYSTTHGTQGICPSGWHIPTLAEFETLKTAVNNDGNALKAIGQGTGNGTGSNTSGFSSLLAGIRHGYGEFSHFGYLTFFWSSTKYDTDIAYGVRLDVGNSFIDLITSYKNTGLSLRCAKD